MTDLTRLLTTAVVSMTLIQPQVIIMRRPIVASAAAPTITRVHEWQSSGCTSGTTCSVTITGGISAGNFVFISCSNLWDFTNDPSPCTSASAGLGTTVRCPNIQGANTDARGFLSCMYVLSASAFSGPLVVTWPRAHGGAQVNIREYSVSSGSLAFDSACDFFSNPNANTFSGCTADISGSNGLTIGTAIADTSMVSAASPYDTNDTASNDQTGAITADNINITANTAISWTGTATVTAKAYMANSFSFSPTACSYNTYQDFAGGTSGNAPTTTLLNASTDGGWGTGTDGQTDASSWSITNPGSRIKYLTGAYQANINPAPRLCSGGTTYSDTSTVGIRMTHTATPAAAYIEYLLMGGLDWSGPFAESTVTAHALFRTNYVDADSTGVNLDMFAIYGGGTGGDAGFVNAILSANGGLHIQLEARSGGATTIPISTNTWYQLALKRVKSGTSSLCVYDMSGVIVGSCSTLTAANGEAAKIIIGDFLGTTQVNTRWVEYGKIKFCHQGTCPFPDLF